MIPILKDEVPDLIWCGRLHIGDQPAMYGDAQFAGLVVEFPVELVPFPGHEKIGGSVLFRIDLDEVKAHSEHPAHSVSVFGFQQGTPKGWTRSLMGSCELASNKNVGEVHLKGSIPRYLIVRIEVNTTAEPGLYDDVVVRRLTLISKTHYGYLGFRAA